MTLNIRLQDLLDKKPTIEDIVSTITDIKDVMRDVSQELHYIKQVSKTTTEKKLYLNKLHSVYGIFLLEMNSLITETEIHLRESKLSNKTIENLFNDPYTKPAIPSSVNSNDSPPNCCCFKTKKKLITVTPT